jgi:Electron transfer DM13
MQIAATLRGSMRRHPALWGVTAIAAGGLVAFVLYWFAPWNLFVDRRVDEAIPIAPGVVADDATMADESEEPATGGADTDEKAEGSEPLTLASGEFRSLEHGTTGVAVILQIEDGSRFLRLEGLKTSNGPDLRVILTDQPVSDDWHVWDDGAYLDLGALKGNVGSSNYAIPDDLDLSGFDTAVIWCRRFSVGFGVAPLEAPSG